jgi:hypothetical protein
MQPTRATVGSGHERFRMKTALKRLQQLEQRHSELVAANNGSGARERILEKISAMADPKRGNPDWELTPMPTLADLRERIQKAVSHRQEAGLSS